MTKHYLKIDDLIVSAKKSRADLGQPCSYGLEFLDQYGIGVHPKSLVLIGADSGVGKTTMVTNLIEKNLALGKKVTAFILEGDPDEFADRLLFRRMAQLAPKEVLQNPKFDFGMFRYGLSEKVPQIVALEEQAKEQLKKEYANLTKFNTNDGFKISEQTIQSYLTEIAPVTDLIVIDHLHYFDSNFYENQNAQISKIMRSLQIFTKAESTPVVLVSHVRKPDNRPALVLDQYQLKGSSSIYQEADEVILVSSYKDSPHYSLERKHYPTLFRFAKSRRGCSSLLIGEQVFSGQLNRYDSKVNTYRLHENVYDKEEKRTKAQVLVPIKKEF